VSDHEEAAQMQNRCRSRGIAWSTIELLICSVAYRPNWLFFTTNRDFGRHERVLTVKLHGAVVGDEIVARAFGRWNRNCRREYIAP
jgi:hypothetical protein